MTTIEAVADALTRGKVRKAYKPAAFRKINERLKKGQLTLDWMVKFLKKHNYTIKHEYNWSKPRVKKGEEPITAMPLHVHKILNTEFKQEDFAHPECNTHTGKRNPDEHGRAKEGDALTWGLEEAFDGIDQLPQPCYTCQRPIDRCVCGEKNTTETPII